MIQRELYYTYIDGTKYYRTYSDDNVCIRQNETDRIYVESVDIETENFTYSETDIPISELLNG